MKTVTHILGPSGGGIRRHVRYLADHPPRGYQTAEVWGPRDLQSFFEGLAFRPLPRWWPLGGLPAADLLHAHGLTVGTVGFRRRRPPLVLTLHMDVPLQGRTAGSPALRALAPSVVRRADAVIAVSERIAGLFPRARAIPPAADPLPVARRSREEVRGELASDQDAVIVLALARLHPDKALDVLIDGARTSGVEVWIAGEGGDRKRLERLAAGAPVRFLGWRDDVPDLLGAVDALAMTSVGEGYPIAVVEAVSAGLPVVATRAGAIPEIVGDAGLLVDVGDRAGFGRALRQLAVDAGLRQRLRARSEARRLPASAELSSRVGRVYEDVLA